MATAAKAKLFLRELKTVKVDLAFIKTDLYDASISSFKISTLVFLIHSTLFFFPSR